MAVRVEVLGDYACFTRPEMKVEWVSYDMITLRLPGGSWRPFTGIPG